MKKKKRNTGDADAVPANKVRPVDFRDESHGLIGAVMSDMRWRAGCRLRWSLGKQSESVELARKYLQTDPSDRAEIRRILLPWLIYLNQDSEAEGLFTQYREDSGVVWKYSRALLNYKRSGDTELSRASLQAALAENSLIPHHLSSEADLPEDQPERYGIDRENDAILYAIENRELWQSVNGALEWLSTNIAEAGEKREFRVIFFGGAPKDSDK